MGTPRFVTSKSRHILARLVPHTLVIVLVGVGSVVFDSRTTIPYIIRTLDGIAVTNKNYLSSFLLQSFQLRQRGLEFGLILDRLSDDDQAKLASSIETVKHPVARESVVAALALQRNPRWEQIFVSLKSDPSYEVRGAALVGLALLPRLEIPRDYLKFFLEAKSPNVSVAILFLIEKHRLKKELETYRATIWPGFNDPSVEAAFQRIDAEAGDWQ